MGYFSHRVGRDKIVAGDHIYTWRTGFTYSHHGIYVGENKVVHFTTEETSSSTSLKSAMSSSKSIPSSFNSSSSSKSVPDCPPDCGFRQPGSGVVLSCMDCFLAGGSSYRFEYGARGLTYIVKRGGTCTTAKSDAAEVVVHRAMNLLHHGYGNYSVIDNNCEHFALYCKTALLILDQWAPGRSGQVHSLNGATAAAIVSLPLRWFMSNPIGIAAARVGSYCLFRYDTDIGVRSDVIRVEVKEMLSFRCSKAPKEPTQSVQCPFSIGCSFNVMRLSVDY